MKNNTKHVIFKNFIKYLYKKKIKYCVLTNGKNFPSQIIRDIDFYINFSNKSELINLVNIFCNKNSLKIEKELNNASSFIKNELSKRLHLKRLPSIKFVYDKTAENSDRIEKIMKLVSKK